MENTQQPAQTPATDPRKKAVSDLIKHYEPDAEVTDDYLGEVVSAYGSNDELFQSLIKHYEPDAEVDSTYLSGIYSSYGIEGDVKKKSLPDGSEDLSNGVSEQSKSSYKPLILAPKDQEPGIPTIKPDENWRPKEAPAEAQFIDGLLNDGRKPVSELDERTRAPFLNFYKENYNPLKKQLGVDDETMQLYVALAEGIRTQEIKQDNWFDRSLSNLVDGETLDAIAETITDRSYGFINMHEGSLPAEMAGIDPKDLNRPEVAAQAVLLKIHGLFNDPNIQQIPELERRIDAVTASYNQGATGETDEGKSYPERYFNNRVKDGGNLDLEPFRTDTYSLDVYSHLPEETRKRLGINPVQESDLYDTKMTMVKTPDGGMEPKYTRTLKPEVAARIEAEKTERIAIKQEETYDRYMAGNEYVDGHASTIGLYKQYLRESGQEDKLSYIESKKEAGKSVEKEELNLFNEAVQFKAAVLKRKGERLEKDPALKEISSNLNAIQEQAGTIQQQAQVITSFLEAEKAKGEGSMDVSAYNQKVVELNGLQEEYKKLMSQEDDLRNSEQFQAIQALSSDWKETEQALNNRLITYPNAYKEFLLQKSKSIAANKEYSESTASKLYQQVVAPIGHALANSAEGLLSLPRTIAANNEYGWTDWLAEQGTEMAGSARDNQFAQAEIFNQGLFIKDADGKEEFQAELLPNKIIRTGADMALLLVGAGKIAAPLKGLGMGAKAATGTGLFASSFATTHNSYYEAAIAEGLTPKQASAFALSSGMVTSSLEFINPQKYLIGGSEVKRQVVKEFAREIAKGQSSKIALKSASKFLAKEIVGENVQELSQMMGDKSVEYMANNILDEEKFEEFRGDLASEFKETVVLTTIVAGLPAVVNAKQPMNELQRNAMLTAAMDESYRPKIMQAFEEAGIDEATRGKVLQKVEVMAEANTKIPEVYQGNDRAKILDLMVEMGEIETSIKGKHALFTVSEREQIKEIKEKVNKIINSGKVVQAVQEAKAASEQGAEQPTGPVRPEPVQETQERPGEEPVSTQNEPEESVNSGIGTENNQTVDVQDTNVPNTTPQSQEIKEIRIEVGSKKTPYVARKTENGLEIINEKTGKNIDRKSRAYNEVVSAYTKENLETFANKPFIEITQEVGQEEYNRLVAEKSDSPLEVALAWNTMQEAGMDYKTQVISENIQQIPKESFYRFGDRNNTEGAQQIRTNYLSKEGTPLDVQAKNISEQFGIEVSPEDLAQFVTNFPGGAKTAKAQDPAISKLEERFKTLTGLPITKNLVNDLAGVESQAEALEKLDNAVLDIISSEGITLDNIDSMKEDLFSGFPFTEEDFNLIKNYLQNEGQQETKSPVSGSENTAANQQSEGSAAESTARKQEGVKRPKETEASFSRGEQGQMSVEFFQQQLEDAKKKDEEIKNGGKIDFPEERKAREKEIKRLEKKLAEAKENQNNQKPRPKPPKASVQYVNEVIDRLRKIFPNLPVTTDTTAFNDALAHAQANEPDNYKDGDAIFGFFFRGTFYINVDNVREDTPIHEFAHPFVLLMKEKYPAMYRKGVELVEKSHYYKEIANSPAYKIPDGLPASEREARVAQQKEEAMVTAIGERGAELFKARYNKETASFRNRMRQFIKDFWNGLRYKIGFPPSINLQNLTLEEFASISANELLSGRTITDKTAEQLDYRTSFNIPLGQVNPGLLRGSHIFTTDKSDPDFYRSKTQRLRRFLTRGLHDRYFRITELVEKAATNLTDGNNVAQKVELMKGKAVAIMEKMEEKVIKSKPNSKKKALLERLIDDKLDIDTLGKFMYALHAPERNAHVAKVREGAYKEALEELADKINEARVKVEKYKQDGDKALEKYWSGKQKDLMAEVDTIRNGDHEHIYLLPDGGSGMTNREAKAIIDQLKKEGTHDQYLAYADEFQNTVIRPNLENMVKAGILTQKDFDFLKYDNTSDGYKHYVPLMVKIEALNKQKSGGGASSGLDMVSKGIHASVGSARYTHEYRENPIDAALSAFRTTAINLEKNLAGQSLLKFAQDNPDPTIYEIRKPTYMPRYDQDGDISSVDIATQKADNEIQVFVDGQVVFLKVNDKDLIRALKDLDSKGISTALEGIREFVGAVHNWLRLVYTGINPEFLITNFARDMQTALINISKEEAQGVSKEIVKNVIPAMRGIFGTERGLESGTKWNKAYRELVERGGKTSWFESNDLKERTEDLRKELERYQSDSNLNKLRKNGQNLFQFLQDLNTSVEMAARTAAYKALVDRGVSKDKAASVAKNLTVNFEKKGLFTIFLDTFYLFSNAAIQGSAIIIKNLATSKAVRQQAFAVTAFSILVNIWNDAVDEEDEYWMIEGEKERNMVFMLPKGMRTGGVNRLTMPLPYGFNIFKVMGDIAYETAVGRSTPAKVLAKTLSSFTGAFSPINGDISTAWVPTLVKPFVEIGLNKNYMGAPIMPEHQQFRKHKKDSERYFKSVSPFAKWISKELDELGGGTENKEGEILGMSTSISPEIIEHLGTTYTGGLGKFLLNTATTTQKIIEGEMPSMQNIPVVRQFVKEESEWAASQIIWEMWENSEKSIYSDKEVELFENSINNAKESGIMKSKDLRDKLRDFRKSQKKLKKEETKKKES
jgi:hypothetical protein